MTAPDPNVIEIEVDGPKGTVDAVAFLQGIQAIIKMLEAVRGKLPGQEQEHPRWLIVSATTNSPITFTVRPEDRTPIAPIAESAIRGLHIVKERAEWPPELNERALAQAKQACNVHKIPSGIAHGQTALPRHRLMM